MNQNDYAYLWAYVATSGTPATVYGNLSNYAFAWFSGAKVR